MSVLPAFSSEPFWKGGQALIQATFPLQTPYPEHRLPTLHTLTSLLE